MAVVHAKRITEKRIAGLLADVCEVLTKLYNVTGVTSGRLRSYDGQTNVKVRECWHDRCVSVSVRDSRQGCRELFVYTPMPGCIARVLIKQLQQQGITVIQEG